MSFSAKEILLSSSDLKRTIAENSDLVSQIEKAAALCIERIKGGGTIYTCGNGGSTCDAMHFAEELVARYKADRPGIRAHHLMDSAVLTCWANDYEFSSAYERQVETYCTKNDLLVAITTSGNSENVVRAINAAKKKGAKTIALLGKDGGKAKEISDISIIVPSNATERIQEVHITIIHILCESLETAALTGKLS